MTKDDLEDAYRAHDPAQAEHQAAAGVVAGPEGVTVVAHANPTGDGEHTWLLRLDPDGKRVWERHYDARYGAARGFARTDAGGFVIAGDVQRAPTAYQGILFAVDAVGTVVAARALGRPGVTGFSAVRARADGSIVAGGGAPRGWLVTSPASLEAAAEHTLDVEDVRDLGVWPTGETAMLAVAQRSTSGFGKAALVAVGADGSTRWVRPLPGDSPGDPAAVVVQPTGALAIGSGAAGDRELAHIWLAMVDRAGAVRWERRITGGGENARAWAAVALPDGYAIGGETATTDGTRTPHVWRIGKDGEPRWDERYPGQPGAFDIINAIATTSDGGFVLAGSTTHGPGKTNVLIIGLAADGAVRWRHTMVATAGP